jgi:YcaO-like protein with predicted kinase domain
VNSASEAEVRHTLWSIADVLATENAKMHWLGTHRALSPETTWERIQPVAEHVGVARVADVTWLDCIGIPTFQAVRPRAKSLSVSQGKGVTSTLAKVSAVMESIELWHGEYVDLPTITCSAIATVSSSLGYDPFRLCLARPSALSAEVPIAWVEGKTAGEGRSTMVPRDFVDMDSSIREQWYPPMFAASSNGLSSGNTFEEAVLHGLYEVLERESVAVALGRPRAAWTYVDTRSLPPVAAELAERFSAAGVQLVVADVTGPSRVPCYHAYAWSDGFPLRMAGAGCHLDPDVALCRALSEVAQARITQIAGSRDDLKSRSWRLLRDSALEVHVPPSSLINFNDADHPVARAESLIADLASMVEIVSSTYGSAPIVVDLTKPDVGVPVAKVIMPGFRYGEV